ncbi:MAG: 1,2-diacylglycerol 3-glucosyltransferase [Herpetosiphonaceae bacterium]|nr:MAG: 1,2-diacylglycerol 3-glucosyltransferase [Herpetosiphonaceae bacterium]
MRILMLDNEFPPLGGGTGVVNYHILKELAGYPEIWVDLVTSSRSRDSYEQEDFAERIKIYKVPVDNRNIHHSTNHELLRYCSRGLRLSRKLLKERHYDLSFAFAGVPAGAISYILYITAHLPYIVSLQGPDVPGFEARYNYLYPFLRPILRIIWGKASVVTAISRKHEQLARQTMPDLNIPIIYNGVETDVFIPAETRSGPINVLCVGRLIERKGQHHLLRAFARLQQQLPNHLLVLTLVGTGDFEPTLKHLAYDLGIIDSVHFTGFVSREEMPALYRSADIFVLPSQNEGMSIALLEALASGLPVVVTDTGGTDELVTPGINGLVVGWADVEALVAALQKLIEDENLRRRMGTASRQVALRFSWRNITEQYVDLMARSIRVSQEASFLEQESIQ